MSESTNDTKQSSNTKLVAQLRQLTGIGIMDCRNALIEANNDFPKAIEILRKKGQEIAANRLNRETFEGCVFANTSFTFANILALKCETDFVAKNVDFIKLTQNILDLATEKKCLTKESVLEQSFAENRTVKECIEDYSGKTGEKVELAEYYSLKGPYITNYIHPGNKLATIVAFNKAPIDPKVAKEIAMHITAMNPLVIAVEDVTTKMIQSEIEVNKEQARKIGKPEALINQIAHSLLSSYYDKNVLLRQKHTKNSKITIQEYLSSVDDALQIINFKRIALR